MGMIGSVGKFFGGLKTPGADGLSTADKLAYLATGFGDPEDFARGTQMIGAKRAAFQKQAAQTDFEKLLAGKLGPQYENGPDPTVNIPTVAGGEDTLAGGINLRGQAAQPPPPQAFQYQPPRKVSDGLNANSPELPQLVMAAQKAGYSMDDVLKVMQMQQPDVRYDRGFGTNTKTGQAVGAFHPDVGEGRVATLDGSGNPTGVNNLPGYTNAIGQVEAAKSAAQAGFAPVQTHDQYGRPVTTTALQIAQNPMFGSTPAQDAYDQASGTAAGQASQQARDAGMKANQTLDLLGQAETLLNGGNVITGFGAEQRLGAERAAATLLKDPKAAARVADTETYQNLVNRQVLPLLKQMGSSNSITDTDREFIKGIVGGSITLNPETMRRVIEIGKREAGRTQQNATAYGRPATPGAPRSSGSGYSVIGVRRAGQ